MASYSFVTTWRLHAPIEEVWEALIAPTVITNGGPALSHTRS